MGVDAYISQDGTSLPLEAAGWKTHSPLPTFRSLPDSLVFSKLLNNLLVFETLSWGLLLRNAQLRQSAHGGISGEN